MFSQEIGLLRWLLSVLPKLQRTFIGLQCFCISLDRTLKMRKCFIQLLKNISLFRQDLYTDFRVCNIQQIFFLRWEWKIFSKAISLLIELCAVISLSLGDWFCLKKPSHTKRAFLHSHHFTNNWLRNVKMAAYSVCRRQKTSRVSL
jgi:hypothetical protein